jgi:hypothetical protein
MCGRYDKGGPQVFEQLLDMSKHEVARLGDRVDLEGKLSERCMDEEKLVSSTVDYS